MNFTELYKKIAQLDETVVPPQPGAGAGDECGDNLPTGGSQPLMGEEPVDECGDMPGDIMHPPKQNDSVTMNVSMNGSGAGGIRDLMDILRNLEDGPGTGHDAHANVDKLFGSDDVEVGEDFQDATTRPNTVTLDIDSVTQTGNDLASKGGNEVEKVNGGGNPYTNVSEGLVDRLNSLYTEVKSR